MPDAIAIKGVRKTFGTKVAVENLDLVVPEGSLCGFIGPNGAGKTTTIRLIMSILFPDSGELRVLGKASAIESKDRIGYLPEERGIYKKMRVGEFLRYIARLKGIDAAPADAKVRQWLTRVGLEETYRKKCEELSKGMQQKVQFISAVIHEPDLLILDEVFTGLDPVNRRLMRELISEQRRAGRTIIFSTHAMREAEELCDHLFMINNGIKVLDLPMSEVWKRYDPRTITVEPIAGGPSLREVSEAWGRMPDVLRVVMGPGAEPGAEPGTCDLLLRDDADPAGVMRAVAASITPRRLELRRASLEDIFISIVGISADELERQNSSQGQEVARA